MNINRILVLTGIFLLTSSIIFAQKSEKRTMDSFSGIALSSSVDAVINSGNTNEITVESDKLPLEKIVTEVENGVLKIYIERNFSTNNFEHKSVVYISNSKLKMLSTSSSGDILCKADLSQPNSKMSTSSSGDITIEGSINSEDVTIATSSSGDIITQNILAQSVNIRTSSSGDIMLGAVDASQSITIATSSSGDIRLNSVKTNELKVNQSSSGDVKILKGNAKNANVASSSSGDLLASQLSTDITNSSSSGSGDLYIGATKALTISISGSGDVYYKGNPLSKKVNKSGSGDAINDN